MKFEHTSVLLNESITALNIQADGVYADCTFGRGGHSQAILNCLSEQGRLLAFDRDPAVLQEDVYKQLENDTRFNFNSSAFDELETTFRGMGLAQQVNGILFDLGVSSPQLDNAARGFSFMRDGKLDMRMDTREGMSAAEWIESADETEIANVLYEYGEERHSRRLAKAIVNIRQETPIETTLQLAEVIKTAYPGFSKKIHPATRSFQAIRIFINRELSMLREVLLQAMNILAPGGRLVVISFHSLEDRIVKQFIKEHSTAKQLPADLPVMHEDVAMPLKKIGKAIKASAEEVAENVRSRSAIMRVAEKVAV